VRFGFEFQSKDRRNTIRCKNFTPNRAKPILDFLVPLSSTKRALIAVAVMICLAGACLAVYIHRQRRPLPGASAGPAPDILTEVPPDAPVIAYIDVAALRGLQNSPLTALLGLASPGPQADRDYKDFVQSTGFDYTHDLDKAVIAFWPQSFNAPADVLGENRALTIAEGRFDNQKIEAYALRTGKMATRGTRTIYEVPGIPPVSFEFLSPVRMALASGKNSEVLLDPVHSPERNPAMQARIERVAGASIFAVARTDNLPPSFYAGFKNSPQLERLARSVKSLALSGKPDGERIRTTLDAECNTMKDALELATLLDTFRMVGAMALADPKTRRQLTREQAAFLDALVNKVKVSHQEHWVRLNLDITPAMLGGAPPARRPRAAPAPAP
jgi:hypothetical protein